MSSNPQAVRDLIVKPSGDTTAEWTLQVIKEAIRAGRVVRQSDVERLEADVTAIMRENRELRAKVEPLEVDAETLEALPCILGRYYLCNALQEYWPYFWKSLFSVWQISARANETGHPGQAQIEYAEWREDVRICDSNPWIGRDIIKPTFAMWDRFPGESQDVLLNPQGQWWVYKPSERLAENFRYAVDHCLRATDLDNRDLMEAVDNFCEQETRAHADQLHSWKTRVRKAAGADDRGMMVTHARWTAQFIGGATPREIADHAEGGRKLKQRNPDKYVRISISRFCKKIELVLPAA